MTFFAFLPRSSVVHVLTFAGTNWDSWCSSLAHPVTVHWEDGEPVWTHGTAPIRVEVGPEDLPVGHRLCRACEARLTHLARDLDVARTTMNPPQEHPMTSPHTTTSAA